MVLSEPGHLDATEFPVPDVAEEGALLEVEATSVCGTDLSLYKGTSSLSSHPIIMGHEVSGRIVDGAEETLKRWDVTIGDRVLPEPYLPCNDCENCHRGQYHMCTEQRLYGITLSSEHPPHLWGGYGEYLYLHPDTRVHHVSDDVPPRAACLGSVVGNGVRWIVEKGQVDPGDSVAIVGPGAQGLATTIVADAAGADPLVVLGLPQDDPNLELAEDLGATQTMYTTDEDVLDRGRTAAGVEGFDVVVVTAPAEPAVRLGIDLVRPRGRLVQVGLLGSDPSIQLDDVVYDEITLLGGRGQAGNVERAMRLLERTPDAVARINSHTFPVAAAETAITRQLPGEEHDPEIVHAVLQPE